MWSLQLEQNYWKFTFISTCNIILPRHLNSQLYLWKSNWSINWTDSIVRCGEKIMSPWPKCGSDNNVHGMVLYCFLPFPNIHNTFRIVYKFPNPFTPLQLSRKVNIFFSLHEYLSSCQSYKKLDTVNKYWS